MSIIPVYVGKRFYLAGTHSTVSLGQTRGAYVYDIHLFLLFIITPSVFIIIIIKDIDYLVMVVYHKIYCY